MQWFVVNTILCIKHFFSDCKEGYYGNYCDEPCPPGSFGVECGGRCFPKCTKEDCHHISGCPNYIENTTIQFGDGMTYN